MHSSPPAPAASTRMLRQVAEGLSVLGRSMEGAALLLVLDRSGRVIVDSQKGPLAGGETLDAFLARLPAEERPLVGAALKDALSPGLAHAIEFSAGAARYAGRVLPLRAGGDLIGGMLVAVDITARVRDEERLRRSDRLMRDTEGSANLGTWEWDPREPNAWWSDELYAIYALDPKTHVPTYQDYLTRVHPDDRERVIKATEGVFRDFRAYSHDERIYRPDGSMRWLHTWAHAVLGPDGKLARLVGVCQDVTDRKTSEERLASQVELLEARVLELEERLRATSPR